MEVMPEDQINGDPWPPLALPAPPPTPRGLDDRGILAVVPRAENEAWAEPFAELFQVSCCGGLMSRTVAKSCNTSPVIVHRWH